MHILITTGIYPPRIGGPAQYAKNLKEALIASGHDVSVATFTLERFLPSGLRHFYFFLKVLPWMMRADFCIALDTFSVGLPSVAAGLLIGKKVIIRTGGDFLWEEYLERTKKKILLREFYNTEQKNYSPFAKGSIRRRRDLSWKERLIFQLTRWTLKNASAIVFSTEWQRDIWQKPYNLNLTKAAVIENYYGPKESPGALNSPQSPLQSAKSVPEKKIFVGGSRPRQFKNLDVLRQAFESARAKNPEIILDLETASYDNFLAKMKRCYAVILVSLGDISPNMILDAIRLNKPFILTKESGFHDKLKDIGMFVDPLNANDIKEKVLWLADEENYKLTQEKIKNFHFTHTWQEIAKDFLNIYQQL